MKRFIALISLVILSVPGYAKTHRDNYNMPCSDLWPAVKDTLKNSGKYGIIGIDNTEFTASYMIGGFWGGKRMNSLVLNKLDDGVTCELQIQTAFAGITHDDYGDLKKRVEASLARLSAAEPVTSEKAKPEKLPVRE